MLNGTIKGLLGTSVFLGGIVSLILDNTVKGNDDSHTPRVSVRGFHNMSCDMNFPTMWYVRPAKAQTSLRIRAD